MAALIVLGGRPDEGERAEISGSPRAATTTASTTTTTSAPPTVPVGPGWRPLGEPGIGGRVTSIAIDPQDPQHVLVGGDLLGVGYSDDGGRTWTRATGLLSLEVSQFTFRPDRPGEVWLGTMSGPHVSRDGGRTWTPMRTGLPEISDSFYTAPIEVVVADRDQPDRLLAFGGSHREWASLGTPAWGVVWESVDDGGTWRRLGTVADEAIVTDAVQLDDGRWLAAAVDAGVFRSADGGASWERVAGGLRHYNVRDLVIAPDGAVYAALAEGPTVDGVHQPGGIFRSVDGGSTWESRSAGLGDRADGSPELTSRYEAVASSPTDPDRLWTADLAYGVEAVYRSEDGGDSWEVELGGQDDEQPVTAYSSPATAEVLAVDPGDGELGFIGQSEYVLRRDAGGEWVDATATPTGDGFAGTGFSGLVSTDIVFDPDTAGRLLLNGLDGGQLLLTSDGGRSWERPLVEWDPWGGAQAISLAGGSGRHVYVLLGQFDVFNGIAVSHDGQETWSFRAGAEAGLPERQREVGEVADIAGDPSDPDAAIATIGGTVYWTDDGGETWSAGSTGSFQALAVGADGTAYVADADGVGVLDRSSGTVSSLEGSPSQVEQLVVDDTTGELYAVRWGAHVGGSGGIDRWDGSTWTTLCLRGDGCGSEADRYTRALAIDPFDPDHLVVVTNDLPFHDRIASIGVLESTDRGATWEEINDGLPVRRVSAVAFDPIQRGRLVVGTFGGGFYQLVRQP